jgi:hypothetical protein
LAAISFTAALGVTIGGIGVGVPELVDRQGTITSGHAITWRDLPIQMAALGHDAGLIGAAASAPIA